MSEFVPAIGNDEQMLADFVQALETAEDRDAVVQRFCAGHPALAKEFEALAGMIQRVDRSKPELDEQVPELLGGFRLGGVIAEGGMGKVYEAYEERLQRRVAIKIIRKGRISPVNRARFLREQMFLARLHQTHTVPIFAAGEAGSLQYYAMPYIDGAALHHVVRTALHHETAHGGKTPTLAEFAKQFRKKQSGQDPTVSPSTSLSGGRQPPDPSHPSHQGADAPRSGSPEATRAPTAPLTLSPDYFRSVAQVMADAADALHHAHAAGILHRDVKPANLMVDTNGESWIIDFGLAGFAKSEAQSAEGEARSAKSGAQSAERDPSDGAPRSALHSPLTASGVMGTPHYMAPEQWQGKADPRSDVWGLGATLYELLTLRRAFDGETDLDIKAKVLEHEPKSPRALVPNLPRDLAAICGKALQKERAKRYETAGEFAEDLRRWLRWEPTVAHPGRTRRRVFRWARRHVAWAIAIALGVISLVSIWLVAAIEQESKRQHLQGELQNAERVFENIELHKLRDRSSGWSEKSWEKIRELSAVRRDAVLRDHAAAILVGVDTHRIGGDKNSSSSVVWSADGKELLIGGWSQKKPYATRLWNRSTGETTTFKRVSDGPVAFSKEGIPLQLVTEKGGVLQVIDLQKDAVIAGLELKIKEDGGLVSILSHDAGLVASAVWSKDEKVNWLIVWDALAKKELFRKETPARRLAFTPDGRWLASGDESGRISLWSLAKGEIVFTLPPARRMILRSLAFGRNAWRQGDGEPSLASWLLAVGDAGGNVTVWDLESRLPKIFCQGSHHDVYAVAFSPDGLTLASAGRVEARIWDSVTGRLLLKLAERNFMTGVAFSPDGQHVAVSHIPVFFPKGGVDVWRLENGRGLQTLRGLSSQVTQVFLSPDGKRIAALAQNWQIGIWELETGKLLRVLDTPQGLVADNAGFCFNANGSQFAFAAGKQAKLWDVATGKELSSWDLPPGLADRMAFHQPTGKLLLFRVETEDGKLMPAMPVAPPDKHPRVCRVWHLSPRKPREFVFEKKDFNMHVYSDVVAPDGSYFAAVGVSKIANELRRTVRAFDAITGKQLVEIGIKHGPWHSGISIDPLGTFLAYQPEDSELWALVEMPSGKALGNERGRWNVFGPHTKVGTAYAALPNYDAPPYGISLFRRPDPEPVIRFGVDTFVSSGQYQFHPNGTRLAWGNTDGSVTVADLPEIKRRLAKVGLEW